MHHPRLTFIFLMWYYSNLLHRQNRLYKIYSASVVIQNVKGQKTTNGLHITSVFTLLHIHYTILYAPHNMHYSIYRVLMSFRSLFWFIAQNFTVLNPSHRSQQPCFQLQQTAVANEESCNKPTVPKYLPSTEWYTTLATSWWKQEHWAAKEPDIYLRS